MKRYKKIITSTVSLCSGMTFSSLLISNSDLWKFTLSITLLLISLRMAMEDSENN